MNTNTWKDIPQTKMYWVDRPNSDRKMDRNKESKNWIEDYKNSVNHPHRKKTLEILRRLEPSSLLEVGANCGPNLALIQAAFPHMTLKGIEPSRQAAFAGATEEYDILIGDASHLPFGIGAFDCVLADAVLMYVPPEEIRDAMREICRVAKKHVILVEWHDESVEGVVKDFHYARNYTKHLEYYGFEVEMIKITEEMWPTEKWVNNGYYYVGTKNHVG